MEPWMLDLLKALGPIILGGSLLIGVAKLITSRAEARKTLVEANKLNASIGHDSDSVSAQAMREAVATMREIAADANASRERAEAAETAVRVELERERENNRRLIQRVDELEVKQRVNDREKTELRRRVTKLEGKLRSSKELVEELVHFIKTHSTNTGDIPIVDYKMFEL